MAENERPLPTPPRSRFGRQVRGEEEDTGPSTADRLTQAAAEGHLEEFLQRELPEGEHARNLAMMMLGMSGMMTSTMPGTPSGAPPIPPGTAAAPAAPDASETPGGTGSTVPLEVLAATAQGDVAGLASLLRAEHARRTGEHAPEGDEPGTATTPAAHEAVPPSHDAGPAARAGIDKALIDELTRVAADNQISVDWLLLRAVKLYLEEHRRTGRL